MDDKKSKNDNKQLINIKKLVHFDNLYRKPAVWQVSNRGYIKIGR